MQLCVSFIFGRLKKIYIKILNSSIDISPTFALTNWQQVICIMLCWIIKGNRWHHMPWMCPNCWDEVSQSGQSPKGRNCAYCWTLILTHVYKIKKKKNNICNDIGCLHGIQSRNISFCYCISWFGRHLIFPKEHKILPYV